MFDSEQILESKNRDSDFKSLCALAVRFMGVAVILLAALLAVVQSWGGLTHRQKYTIELGYASFLALAGIFCAVKLNESRGARTLLALTAAWVPIHFCQLGALLLSSVQSTPLVDYPELLRWQAASLFEACGVTILAVAVLLPLTWFAFRVLIGEGAKSIVVFYFGLNALLLFPYRSGAAVIALILVGAVGLAVFYFQHVHGDSRFQTKEGLFTLFLMGSPLTAIFLRALVLYPDFMGPIFIGSILVMLGLSVFFGVSDLAPDRAWRCVLQRMGTLIGLCGLLLINSELAEDLRCPHSLIYLLFGISSGLALLLLSGYTGSDQNVYSRSACFLVLLAGALTCFVVNDPPLFMLVGLVLALLSTFICGVYGIYYDRRVLMGSSLLLFVWELVRVVQVALSPRLFGPWWVVLGLLGVVLVVFASVLEQRSRTLGQS